MDVRVNNTSVCSDVQRVAFFKEFFSNYYLWSHGLADAEVDQPLNTATALRDRYNIERQKYDRARANSSLHDYQQLLK